MPPGVDANSAGNAEEAGATPERMFEVLGKRRPERIEACLTLPTI